LYRLHIKEALRRYRYLTIELFSCFLQPEYSDNLYLFERRIHIQKKCLLQVLTKIHNIVNHINFKKKYKKYKNYDQYVLVLSKLNCLFDITMDYAQLRQRVTDFSELKLCHQEMFAIFTALENYISVLLSFKRNNDSFVRVTEKIQQFERVYQQVLTVTVRDPFIFFLFMSALKKLGQDMLSLQESLLCLADV
jgi:hypothetical protein